MQGGCRYVAGFMVLWFHAFVVLWFQCGFIVLLFYGFLVLCCKNLPNSHFVFLMLPHRETILSNKTNQQPKKESTKWSTKCVDLNFRENGNQCSGQKHSQRWQVLAKTLKISNDFGKAVLMARWGNLNQQSGGLSRYNLVSSRQISHGKQGTHLSGYKTESCSVLDQQIWHMKKPRFTNKSLDETRTMSHDRESLGLDN